MTDDHHERLDDLQPETRERAQALWAKAQKEELGIFVVSGLRTFPEQRRLFAQGRTTPGKIVTNARPGESYHNFGMAFDFAVLENDALVWNPDHRSWKRFVALGKKGGFEWGGDWSTFKDFPHLQLAGAPTLAALREEFPRGWRAQASSWRTRNRLPLRIRDKDGRRRLVARLQSRLGIFVDGEFGEQTEQEVRRWQDVHDEAGTKVARGQGLPVTGVVDDATWASVFADAATSSWLPPRRIARAVHASTSGVASNWPAIDHALAEVGLDDEAVRIAAAATVVVEVGAHFEPINEFGDKAYFTRMYEGREDLGNDHPGDGARFHGRGYIQLTGRANYRTYGKKVGVPLERHPEQALDPEVAARVLATYFKERGVATSAKKRDWEEVRRRVNGGLNGWPVFEAAVKRLEAAVK